MLFVASLLLPVAGLGSVAVSIARFLADDEASRRWARMAAVPLVLSSAAFARVAMTPENTQMSRHLVFTIWAWRFLPCVALLLGLASRDNARMRPRASLAWFGAALMLAAYAALSSWGPSVAQPHGLLVQVVARKVATVVALAALLIGAGEVKLASRNVA